MMSREKELLEYDKSRLAYDMEPWRKSECKNNMFVE